MKKNYLKNTAKEVMAEKSIFEQLADYYYKDSNNFKKGCRFDYGLSFKDTHEFATDEGMTKSEFMNKLVETVSDKFNDKEVSVRWKKTKNEYFVIIEKDDNIVPQYQDENGYSKVDLINKEGETKSEFVHNLMWLAWKGEIPEGMEVYHVNGIKTDNRLGNLALREKIAI